MYPELKRDYELNHIRQFQGIVLGRPGSGKTQTANWLADALVKKYGEDKVNAISADNLGTMLKAVDDKLVNFLFLDDLTLSPVKKQHLANYFKIRHIIQSRTGRSNGIVITLLGLHRFYGCDPSIRSNYDFILFRSAPTNEYDRNWTKRHIGDDATNLLSNLEMDRNKKLKLFDTTITWLKGKGSGYIPMPLPEDNRLSEAHTYGGSKYHIGNKKQLYDKLLAEHRRKCDEWLK